MKKFIKWIGIIVAALIAIPIIVAVVSIIFEGPQGEQTQKKELTQVEKDSIQAVELQNEIAEIEKQIAYLNNYIWPANNLLAQYESNELKADGMFKGNKVTITGKIQNIGSDIVGQPYITIGNYNYSSVQCIFPKSKLVALGNLNKGQTVLLKGVCKGKLMNVLFEDCKFIENIPQLKKKLKELKSEK